MLAFKVVSSSFYVLFSTFISKSTLPWKGLLNVESSEPACLSLQGMKGVADRAGGVIGGHMGFAMQAGTDESWLKAKMAQFVLLALVPLGQAATISTQALLGTIFFVNA